MVGFNRFRGRLLMAAITSALLSVVNYTVDSVRDLVFKMAAAVLEPVSMARAEAELAQNAASNTPTNNGKALVGPGSGGSPVSFVSMLKDLNSRASALAC